MGGFAPKVYAGNQFNTGVNYSVTILNATTGKSANLGGRMHAWEASPKENIITGSGMDYFGIPDHVKNLGGWTGTIGVERYNGDFEDLMTAIDTNFFSNGGSQYFTITRKVRNNFDNSISTRTYKNCIISSNEGSASKDATVKFTITFHASERV